MHFHFEQIEKLIEYEKRFVEEIQEKDILILRDIDFTEEDYAEIKNLIRKSLKNNGIKILRERTPLCISLFLLWCVIYNYKEGDMWGPVLSEMSIKNNHKNERILGEIFLKTVRKYNLLEIKDSGAKKYLSPILMHGYISNYYSGRLFDRLNKLYEVVLDRDSSYENIEKQWEIMFPEDDSLPDKLKTKGALEREVSGLEEELKDFITQDYFVDFSRDELIKLETELDSLRRNLDGLIEEREEITRALEELEYINEESIEIIQKTSILSEGLNNVASEISGYIHGSFVSLLEKLSFTISDYTDRQEHIISSIKKLSNEEKIKQGKIIDNKTKISILGSGDLEYGWDLLDEYNKLSESLSDKKGELEKIKKVVELETGNEHTSFIQTYTASLYHLSVSSPDIFKKFIKQTIQMMDTYFRLEEIDMSNQLADQFIGWYKDYGEKQKKQAKTVDYITPPTSKGTSKNNERRKRKISRSDSLREPYLELGNDKHTIELVIPEQTFSIPHNIETYPTYRLSYDDSTEESAELATFKKGSKVIIHEHRITLRKASVYLTVEWLNIRNMFMFDMDTVTVFNQYGKVEKNHMLENGLYYVLTKNTWELEGDDYISISNSSVHDYRIMEVPIIETSIDFKNIHSQEKIILLGSKYNGISMEEYRIAEGITSDGLEIIVGTLPKIIYNNSIIDHDELSIDVMVDNMRFLSKDLAELSKKDELNENIFVMDLNYILKRKYNYPARIDIDVTDGSGEKKLNISYVWVTNTSFKYDGNMLVIYYPEKGRVRHPKVTMSNYKAILPLLNSPYEDFEIYYDGFGAKKFSVEVPSIEISMIDKENNNIENGYELIKDDLNKLKNYVIEVRASGTTIKSIELFNSSDSLDISVPLRRGRAMIELDSIIDFICEDIEEDILKLRWVGKTALGQENEILKVYKDWVINEIDVYQEEMEDEYILEIKYHENFNYTGEKLIRLINEGELIFEKELKKDNPFYYIKKDSVINDKVRIEIFRKKQSGLFASRFSKGVLAGQKDIRLKSRIREVERVKRSGLILNAFSYKKKTYNLLNPLAVKDIRDGEPLNFTGESIYNGVAKCSGNDCDVIFYLDTEKKKVPILLDMDRDGAQYDLKTGEIFWELRKGNNILAPVEDFDYEIKE